jgi:hypothetical protein
MRPPGASLPEARRRHQAEPAEAQAESPAELRHRAGVEAIPFGVVSWQCMQASSVRGRAGPLVSAAVTTQPHLQSRRSMGT